MLLNESSVSSKFNVDFEDLLSMSTEELISAYSSSFAENYMSVVIEKVLRRTLKSQYKQYSPIKVYCKPKELLVFSGNIKIYSVKNYAVTIAILKKKINRSDLQAFNEALINTISSCKFSTFAVESCETNMDFVHNCLRSIDSTTTSDQYIEDDFDNQEINDSSSDYKYESSDIELIQASDEKLTGSKYVTNSKAYEFAFELLLQENRSYLRSVSTKATKLFIDELANNLSKDFNGSLQVYVNKMKSYWNLLYNLSIIVNDHILIKTSINYSTKEIYWLVKSKKLKLDKKLYNGTELVQFINKLSKKDVSNIQEFQVLPVIKAVTPIVLKTVNNVAGKAITTAKSAKNKLKRSIVSHIEKRLNKLFDDHISLDNLFTALKNIKKASDSRKDRLIQLDDIEPIVYAKLMKNDSFRNALNENIKNSGYKLTFDGQSLIISFISDYTSKVLRRFAEYCSVPPNYVYTLDRKLINTAIARIIDKCQNDSSNEMTIYLIKYLSAQQEQEQQKQQGQAPVYLVKISDFTYHLD